MVSLSWFFFLTAFCFALSVGWLLLCLNNQEPTEEQTGRTESDRRYATPNLSRKKRKPQRWPSRTTTYWTAAQVETHRPAARAVGSSLTSYLQGQSPKIDKATLLALVICSVLTPPDLLNLCNMIGNYDTPVLN